MANILNLNQLAALRKAGHSFTHALPTGYRPLTNAQIAAFLSLRPNINNILVYGDGTAPSARPIRVG
jgi:hypothetical protein